MVVAIIIFIAIVTSIIITCIIIIIWYHCSITISFADQYSMAFLFYAKDHIMKQG